MTAVRRRTRPRADGSDAVSEVLDARTVPAVAAAWTVTAGAPALGWRGAALLAVVLVATCAAIVPPLRARRRVAWWLVGALLVATGFAAAASVRLHTIDTHPLAAAHDAHATIAGRIVDDPRPVRSAFGPPRVVLRVALDRVELRGSAFRTGGEVTVFAPADGWDTLTAFGTVVLRGRVDAPLDGWTIATIRADDAPRARAPAPAVLGWADVVRADLRAVAARVLPADEAGLLPGLVVGDTSGQSETVRAAMRASGLTHLTAVSGANVTIVVGAALLLTRLVGLGPRATVVLAAVVLVGFVVVVRPSPSVVRAAAMGAIALLALVVGRRRQALPALGTAVVVLLAVFPALASDVGFALSVAATAALVLVTPGWVDRLERRGWPRTVAEVAAVSVAASVATAPVVAAVTGAVSVVSVLANILVAPVVAPITVVGTTIAAVGPLVPQAAALAVRVLEPLVWWILTVAERCAALPGAVVTVPPGPLGTVLVAAAVGVGILVLRRPFGRRMALTIVVSVVATLTAGRVLGSAWPPVGWVVIVCSVGQGDAILVATQDGPILVDTGPEPVAVDACLRRAGVGGLTGIVLTHGHRDHTGGLVGATTGRTVGAMVRGPGVDIGAESGTLAGDAGALATVDVVAGDVIGTGTTLLEVVSAVDHGPENDRSLVLRARTPVGDVLLPGDLGERGQDELAARADVRADVLVVPHHGSASSSERFLASVRPRVAIVSVGAGNPYGHPDPGVLAGLEHRGARVVRTDRHGDIAIVRTGAGGLGVAVRDGT